MEAGGTPGGPLELSREQTRTQTPSPSSLILANDMLQIILAMSTAHGSSWVRDQTCAMAAT